MANLEQFRAETRTWLEANCPAILRTPMPDDEIVWGGRNPTNKYPGPGRDSYKAKQREVLTSDAHLIEIDLLRFGEHPVAVPDWAVKPLRSYDYLVCVNRAQAVRHKYDSYPRSLAERLPRIRVPLANGDRDVTLNVQAAVAQTYEAGSYRDRLKYETDCIPPLSAENQAWANEQIRVALSRSAS